MKMKNTKKYPEDCHFIKKETLAQAFSCEFCEIYKNPFSTEHLWAPVSNKILYSDINLVPYFIATSCSWSISTAAGGMCSEDR